MGEDIKVTPDDSGKEGEVTPEDKVELSAEQYGALLDKLQELEEGKSSRGDANSAAEGTRRRDAPADSKPTKSWDDMSNTELVQNLVNLVRPDLVNLDTKIETIKAMNEIDKCEARHDDFWEYKEQIRDIAIKNPTLSIEQAYKLAKGDKVEAKRSNEAGDPVKDKKKGLLYTLPPRPTSIGEKPGVAPGSTRTSSTKSLKEATERAWDEVVGKGKDSV
jgi:hypothetical protein